MSVNDVFIQTNLSVSTTAVEIKVGSTPDEARQVLRVYNKGPETIYLGPENTVTASGANQGEPLFKDQWIEFTIPPFLTLYGITASGTSTALVQEIGNADGGW